MKNDCPPKKSFHKITGIARSFAMIQLPLPTLFINTILKLMESISPKFFERFPHLLVPSTTLRIVLVHPDGARFGLSNYNGSSVTQVVTDWNATNITDKEVYAKQAFLVLGFFNRRKIECVSLLSQHSDYDTYGEYSILPNSTSLLSLVFMVQPPLGKENKKIIAQVIVVDQFGNKHTSSWFELKHDHIAA